MGERWSLLIVRDVLLGLRRFDEIQAHLGIARNVLQTRLTRLQEQGVLERVPYQERPPRHEYRLTEKGLDLWPTVVALMKWGDRYAAAGRRPAGAARTPRLRRRRRRASHLRGAAARGCGARRRARGPGPGAAADHPLHPRGGRARRRPERTHAGA